MLSQILAKDQVPVVPHRIVFFEFLIPYKGRGISEFEMIVLSLGIQTDGRRQSGDVIGLPINGVKIDVVVIGPRSRIYSV